MGSPLIILTVWSGVGICLVFLGWRLGQKAVCG